MNKEVILQRAIDYLVDKMVLYRMNNIEKDEICRCINNTILLYIYMGREKEIKSFLVNSFGCGILDKEFLSEAQLYWLGKFKGNIDNITLSESILFRVSDLCLLSRVGVEFEFDGELENILKLIMDNEYDIYDLCYIAKWLSFFDYKSEVILIIINYIYMKYKMLNINDKIVEYWFNSKENIDTLIEDYSNKIQLPEIISKVKIEYIEEYYIWRMLYNNKKYIFFTIPYKIFVFRESDGIKAKFNVYNLINSTNVGGINNWKDLFDYINRYGIDINVKIIDKVWMGFSDFFKK